MALSGIQIYKLLPKTNCKECGFPTCLAFAMKLAAKQVELSACPYVTEESKAELAESSAPPIRLVAIKSNGNEVKAGMTRPFTTNLDSLSESKIANQLMISRRLFPKSMPTRLIM